MTIVRERVAQMLTAFHRSLRLALSAAPLPLVPATIAPRIRGIGHFGEGLGIGCLCRRILPLLGVQRADLVVDGLAPDVVLR